MRIFNKFLSIGLVFSFLSSNGMEETNSSHEPEPMAQEKAQVEQPKKPLSYKVIMAIKVAEFVKSGKLTWEQIAQLPEGLPRFVYLVHIANTYVGDVKVDYLENKRMFYEAIAKSQYIEEFVAAIDEFFEEYYDEEYSDDLNKLTGSPSYVEPFNIINLFLGTMLDIKNIEQIGTKFLAKDAYYNDMYKIASARDLFFNCFAKNAIKHNLVFSMELMISLGLFSREDIVSLFGIACREADSLYILKLLNENIEITKEEFETILTSRKLKRKFCRPNDCPNLLKNICFLIEHSNLPINEIINQNYFYGTLLHSAIKRADVSSVKFLVDNGADPLVKNNNSNEDALNYLAGYYDAKVVSYQTMQKFSMGEDVTLENKKIELSNLEEIDKILNEAVKIPLIINGFVIHMDKK